MSEASGVQRYRKLPVVVEMIRWDGSEEAWQLIANHGGVPERLPDGSINIWVDKSDAEMNLDVGGWVIIEPSGTGVYPCTAEDQERGYEPAEPGHGTPGSAAELATLRSGAHTLGMVVTSMARSMEAARIEMLQHGPAAAMEWILRALPDQRDDPEGMSWDGSESAREWLDRTEPAEVAR